MSFRASTVFRQPPRYLSRHQPLSPLPSRTLNLHTHRKSYSSTATARRPISLRPYIYAVTFTILGLTAGQLLRFAYVPPAAPEPGTSEDSVVLRQKEKDIDRLPFVQRFREDGQWRELRTRVGAGEGTEESGGVRGGEFDDGSRTLTKAAMSGSRGLGVQRAFWNDEKGELMMIVWFGQGLSGWPGVAHGGAVATVLEEGLRQTALGVDEDWTTLPEEPNTLNLSYIKPTLANNFYVLRVTQSAESVTKQHGIDPREPTDHTLLAKEVDATLQTLDDKILVKARGTFTLPALAQTQAKAPMVGKSASQTLQGNMIPK